MITAYATFETAVQATKLGAYDFLPKPFTPGRTALRGAQGGRRAHPPAAGTRAGVREAQVRFQFLSVLAHELKAPLVAVEGYWASWWGRRDGRPAQMLGRCLVRSRACGSLSSTCST